MKILVVMKNWLGDILFQLPALEMIAEKYPDAEIVCLAPERCREILLNHPSVSRVLPLDEKREHRSFLAKILLLFKLRSEHWDQAYLFHRSRTRALLLFLAGAKERIGYRARRGWLLTKPVTEPKTPLHQVDYYVELLVRAGFTRPENPAYRFHVSGPDHERAEELLTPCGLIQENVLKPFVAFHLGANWEPKRWPPAHFARLADLLHKKWNLPVVLTGGRDDAGLGTEVEASVHSARIISLIGRTSLGTLGAIFQRAVFVVSGDSGPMHIASGVGTPLVALFGPTHSKLTGPRGEGDKVVLSYVPPGYETPWYGSLPTGGWLQHISPEEVAAAIEKKKWILPPLTDSANAALHLRSPEAAWPAGRGTLLHQNILLVTLSNIGDVILTTPAIARLRQEFPDAHLTVVTGPRAQGVLAGSKLIDRLLVYDKHASFAGQLQFLSQLRSRFYDWVIDLRNTAIPFLVRSRKRSPLFRRFRSLSMRGRHLAVLEKMSLSKEPTLPFDFFHEEDETSVLRKLRNRGIRAERDWILMAPAAASELKTWRLAGFKEVLERLLAERGDEILLVGNGREKKIIEPLVSIQPSHIHNLAGETTLPELAALVSRCALLVTNDSAVMHLGFELDRPVVAIFGPTHHEKYGRSGPHFRIVREGVACSPCESPRCRFERQSCFEDLSADKVFSACKELLYEKSVHEPLSS